MFRYQARAKKDHVLCARLRELSAQQAAYGYLFLHSMLKAEGLVINRKRTCRIYNEERLQVRTKRRKKLQRPPNHLKSLELSKSAGAMELCFSSVG